MKSWHSSQSFPGPVRVLGALAQVRRRTDRWCAWHHVSKDVKAELDGLRHRVCYGRCHPSNQRLAVPKNGNCCLFDASTVEGDVRRIGQQEAHYAPPLAYTESRFFCSVQVFGVSTLSTSLDRLNHDVGVACPGGTKTIRSAVPSRRSDPHPADDRPGF